MVRQKCSGIRRSYLEVKPKQHNTTKALKIDKRNGFSAGKNIILLTFYLLTSLK